MASFGVVLLNDIKQMLMACAPGHRMKPRVHNFVVYYNGRSFPSLPLGKHGARKDPEIKAGHVKQMIRQLGIDIDCARRFIAHLS